MKILVGKLRRFRSLNGQERRLFVAAALMLPLFWAKVGLYGYRFFGACLVEGTPWGRRVKSASGSDAVSPSLAPALDEFIRIGSLVNSAAHHVLPVGNCLTRSLFLQWLLRRRGVNAELRIGVRKEQGQFEAHAWVEYEGRPINDAPDVSKRFAPFDESLTARLVSSP
jgi:hypothetical protein